MTGAWDSSWMSLGYDTRVQLDLDTLLPPISNWTFLFNFFCLLCPFLLTELPFLMSSSDLTSFFLHPVVFDGRSPIFQLISLNFYWVHFSHLLILTFATLYHTFLLFGCLRNSDTVIVNIHNLWVWQDKLLYDPWWELRAWLQEGHENICLSI